MRLFNTLVFVLLSIVVPAGDLLCQDQKSIAPVSLCDTQGKIHTLFSSSKSTLTVLMFCTSVCPITNSYMPTWNSLQEKFKNRGVKFIMVMVGNESDEAIRGHAKNFKVDCTILKDPLRLSVKAVGATNTSQVFLFGKNQAIEYSGRIDDRWASQSQRRPIRSHDLQNAIAALLDGKRPRVVHTESWG